MVERSRRGKGKLLGSHQKCWIWGRHVVVETLRAGTWPPLELHLSTALDRRERNEAADRATLLGTTVTFESPQRLRALCKSGEHQGYVAKMPEYPYATLAGALKPPGDAPPLVAVLDGIQDPYNLGAIVRSADVFGVDAVVLGETNQVGVTSLVARCSAGAVNHVPVARGDLLEFAGRLRERSVPLIGLDRAADATICECDLKRPVALAVGNEHAGLSPALRERCDALARIPQQGRIGSLNAAVAAGIAFYEAARQRAA